MKKNLVVVLSLIFVGSAMIGCASLQSQMQAYDGEIRDSMGNERWNEASRVINHAQFDCEPHEWKAVESWRNRQRASLKSVFSKSLMPMVSEANSYYTMGDILMGDSIRQKMKARYFGTQDDSKLEKETAFSNFFSQKSEIESGLPEELLPCFDLAWINMLSDRNVARMTAAYNEFAQKIEAVNVDGRKKSIKELDAIDEGLEKVGKWKEQINLFMEKLTDSETLRWAQTDRATYAQSIKKMEEAYHEVIDAYKTKRWNTRVHDRKMEYKEIADLTASGDCEHAMQLLQTLDSISKPSGLPACEEYDDEAERIKAASGEVGNYMLKELLSSGLSGVRYVRRSERSGVLSTLIVGNAFVDDRSNKRKIREAVRIAQLQARSEFVRYMSTEVSDETTQKDFENDEQSYSSFSSVTSSRAKADVSNLVLLAKGLYDDNVIVVLGWRSPELGNITVVSPRKMEGVQDVEASSSFGAYL